MSSSLIARTAGTSARKSSVRDDEGRSRQLVSKSAPAGGRGRKRHRNNDSVDGDDGDEEDEEEGRPSAAPKYPSLLLSRGFQRSGTTLLRPHYKERSHIIRVSNSVQMKFNIEKSRSATEVKQVLKAVYRLLLFKGGRKETISRVTINEFLKKIDPKYSKCTNAILREVQITLESGYTGYVLLTTADIIGMEGGKKDEYILCNGLISEKLQQVLSCGIDRGEGVEVSWFSFMLFVFFAVLSAPGQQITLEELCEKMHSIDNRFPRVVNANSKHSSSASCDIFPIPEFKDDFRGLVNRMKREQFLTQLKADVAVGSSAGGDTSIIYTFGPRFYLEVGKYRLVVAYFALLGQPVDDAMLREFDEEYERAIQEDLDESCSEEEEDERGVGVERK